jgi:hypothetical protein
LRCMLKVDRLPVWEPVARFPGEKKTQTSCINCT